MHTIYFNIPKNIAFAHMIHLFVFLVITKGYFWKQCQPLGMCNEMHCIFFED